MIFLFQGKAIHGYGKPSTVTTVQEGTAAAEHDDSDTSSERHGTVDIRDNLLGEELFEKVSEKAF